MGLKIEYIDNGFCRIVYSIRNEQDQKIFYCLQDEGKHDGIKMYRCTKEHEPSHVAKPNSVISIEIPKGQTDLEKGIFEYINNHELLNGL